MLATAHAPPAEADDEMQRGGEPGSTAAVDEGIQRQEEQDTAAAEEGDAQVEETTGKIEAREREAGGDAEREDEKGAETAAGGTDGGSQQPAPEAASLQDKDRADSEASNDRVGPRRTASLANLSTPSHMAAVPGPRRASIALLEPLEPLASLSRQRKGSEGRREKRSRRGKYAKPTLGRLKPLPMSSATAEGEER
jgi:hypothetical protein